MPLRCSAFVAFTALAIAICGLSAQGQDAPAAGNVTTVTRPVTPDQPEAQRRLQGDTELVARRLGTMLRFMSYHRLDQGEEQKLLTDAAKTLSGLSRNEMNAVIAHLEASIKAPDDKTAGDEAKKAYDRHRDVVKNLKGLLLKYDTIKTLDQAADRLERAGRDQNEMRLEALALAQQIREGRVRGRGLVSDATEQADGQGDLNRDLEGLFKQLEKLPPFLTPEQKERLANAKANEKAKRIMDVQTLAARLLSQNEPKPAADNQKKAAESLLELANALRAPRDRLETLKEARAKIDKAMQAQEKIKEETAAPPPRTARTSGIDNMIRHARDMAQKQARNEFDAKQARDLVKDLAKDAADKVQAAEAEMRKAQDELNNTTRSTELAKEPQERAGDELKAARDNLDDLIAKEEKKKSDPLEAVKDAIAKVDQIIKDETKNRDKTEATKGTQTEKMPALSKEQKQIAKDTKALKNQPLPEKPQVKDSLAKAESAMNKAAKSLDDKKGMDAVKNQDQALKDLNDAKKALEEQAKEIQKRRDDIAKLQEAQDKLDELAKKQEKVANDAKEAGKAADEGKADAKSEANELSRDQKPLKPEAKQIGDQVKDSAPKAAEKIQDANAKQTETEKNLDAQKLSPAAKEGQMAAQDLKEAAKEVAKALADKKAQEANDQARLQPQLSPMNAADQIAKALEQTDRAQMEANRAQQQLGEQPMRNPAADLQKLQEQVAQKAGEMKKGDAEKAAAEAAEALKMGDIPGALEAQQKALDGLKPMAGDPKSGDQPMGMPNPSAAKSPGELAQAQKQIKDATEALKNAQQANAAAQAALQQAQAQAPQAVKPQLDQAGQQLGQAQQALQQAQPGQAQQPQAQAQQALQQALQTLQAAQAQAQAQAQGMGMGMGMQPGMGMGDGMGMGMQPGMGMGMGMGMQPGMGMGMGTGQSPEQNQQQGKGDRQADGTLKNSASRLSDVKGDGAFINLPARQREMIQQALSGTLPPEYGAMIRQYFMNVASGKPAAAPTTEKK